MLLHERELKEIIEKAVGRIAGELSPAAGGRPAASGGTAAAGMRTPAATAANTAGVPGPHQGEFPSSGGGEGIFDTVEEAIAASRKAALETAELSLEDRRRIIEALRAAAVSAAPALSQAAVDETGMGRVEDKIKKNLLAAEKTPGIEALKTEAVSGDNGLTLTELAPYGLICSIIPSTNPTETVINNGIGMFAAGNAVVFNPHPGAKRCSAQIISLFARTVRENGGPANCFTAVREPTIETATALMQHPEVRLLVVTGAEGVVNAAMKSGKKVIGAGPGNPPAVVDETADLAKAARDVLSGASMDNNIICVDEKLAVVTEKAADEFVREIEKAGAYIASANQVRTLERTLYAEPPLPMRHTGPLKKYVGKDASIILGDIGVRVDGDPRLVLCDVPDDHPFAWSEMLMPVLPLVRKANVDEAIDYAVRVEAGRRHTASMHSKNIEKLSKMAYAINCSIFVKNGPNYAGLGYGGEGPTSFTIASPTGDGVTTARTYCRERRCTLVGAFRIV